MKRRILAILGCIVLTSPALLAQYRASIQGTVTDTTGAVIPGATLTLTDLGTAQVLTSASDENGLFNFNALPPDAFSLVAERAGFKRKVFDRVQIIPEQPNAFNVQLEAGGVSETVTVTADQQTVLDTETASISGDISSNEIQHLPSFGRDVFQLAQLAPGTFGDMAQGSGGGTASLPGTQGPGGTSSTAGSFATENGPQIVSGGGQYETNGITVDGISTVSAVWGGTSVITPSEDSVGDMKVISNNYDAEAGRFSGAQIEVTSKSGTNAFHGSLFFKADRPGLNAYQRYNSPQSVDPGTPAQRSLLKDESRFNQFGGSIGGPIWKDKIFFFFDYETLRNNTSSTATGWYDTSAFDKLGPAGSISSKYLNFPGSAVSSAGQVSATCATIGLTEGTQCATITGQGLDIGSPLKSALGTQDLTWTDTSHPGIGGGLDGVADIGEYTTLTPTQITNEQYNGRLDVNASKNDRVSFTIYWVPSNTTNYNGTARAYNLYHHAVTNDAFAGIWNHTFSSSLLNEARVNAAGWRFNDAASNPQEPFGLAQDTVQNIGNITLNYFGAPGPSQYNQWTYSYQDVATKILGRHSIKFGGGVTRLYYLNDALYAARPQFTFYNLWDFLNDAPEAEGGNFNPLSGTPSADRQDDREDLYGFFVQDDFKVAPNLTVNLGLRYSYFGSFSSKEGNLNTVQLGTGAGTYSDLSIRRGGNLYTPQKGNFGPQVGFAWSPAEANGKLVLRGGFGVNYNQEEIAIAANGFQNPPSVVNPNFTSVSPAKINPDIIYQLPSDVHSLFGYPPNPHTIVAFNAQNLPTTGSVSVVNFPSHVPSGMTYHYSLDTQYELPQQWVASVGYQSSLAHHIIHTYQDYALAAAFNLPVNPLVNNIQTFNDEGHSNYHAMLAGIRHQFSHDFLLDAQYTWSKSMDDGSGPYYLDPYPDKPYLAYGRSDYNVGQAFKLYGLWQPVFFKGGHSLFDKTVGGWSLSGIFNLHTGFPWTPVFGNITNGALYYQGSYYGSLRPAAYLGGAHKSGSNDAFKSGPRGSDQTSFNTNYPNGALSYFTIPAYTPVTAPLPATFAPPQMPGVSRNFLTGPSYRDVDATISKGFGLPNVPGIGEGARIEIRADAFNVFNLLNMNTASIRNNISTTFTDPVSGVATQVSNPNFGQAQSALGSRTVDLQARFSF
ncbi:MAG TPA: TonB-dependent receptor [Acidobacteriaceae bacterium]